LLALLGAHPILHVSGIRVNCHPQGDVNAYKNMDVLGNIMLTHSSIKFVGVLLFILYVVVCIQTARLEFF
jgi:hypothetical protein